MPRGAVRALTPEEVRKLRIAAAEGPKPERQDSRPAAKRPPRPGGPPRKVGAPIGKGRPPARAVKKPPKPIDAEPARRIIGEDAPPPPPSRPKPAQGRGGPPRRPGGPGPGKRPGGGPGKRPGGGPARGPGKGPGGPKRSGR
jgi:translation initiation factor IF-2